MGKGTGGIPTTDNIPETTEIFGCPTDNLPETTEIFGCPTDNIPEKTEKLGCPTDFLTQIKSLNFIIFIKNKPNTCKNNSI